ncbi:serine hydrolase domain-containing protein [Tsukamurella strandjordii]|uniref:serine hydrolase domain-containing protein n=1 Tax=Tsukamurella strandjordii TaxID=147577 RepID=UPI0031D81228
MNPARTLSAACAATVVATVVMVAPASAEPISTAGRQSVQRALDAMVTAGYPGAQVVVTEGGRDWIASAGVGDVHRRTPFPADGYVRIGSNTKAYVAAVILQLVAERRIGLDDTVDGAGIDGTRITVRDLLQHTSGLPDHLGLPELDTEDAAMTVHDPADLVRKTRAAFPPRFAPGARAEYSNTNYLVLGLLVEKITGRPLAEEIRTRILAPHGLTTTYYPGPGDTVPRAPHAAGYAVENGKRIDITAYDPSWAGASGAMVATPSDLNRYFLAVQKGTVIPPAQLAEARRAPRPLVNRDGLRYGLGQAELPTPCGTVWGHGGSIPGYRTYNGATASRAVTVVANQQPATQAQKHAIEAAFGAALCAR